MPVNAQARIELEPEISTTAASDAGSRKTPEPIMFPTTSAVDIHVPRSRLSSGDVCSVGIGGFFVRSMTIPPFAGRVHPTHSCWIAGVRPGPPKVPRRGGPV